MAQHNQGFDKLDRCSNCIATCLCLLSHRWTQRTRLRWKQDTRWTGCCTDDRLKVEKHSISLRSGFSKMVNRGLYTWKAIVGAVLKEVGTDVDRGTIAIDLQRGQGVLEAMFVFLAVRFWSTTRSSLEEQRTLFAACNPNRTFEPHQPAGHMKVCGLWRLEWPIIQ